jgi:hypothetical protein
MSQGRQQWSAQDMHVEAGFSAAYNCFSRSGATFCHEEANGHGMETTSGSSCLLVQDFLEVCHAASISGGLPPSGIQFDTVSGYGLDHHLFEVGHAGRWEALAIVQVANSSLLLFCLGEPFLVVVIEYELRVQPEAQPPDHLCIERCDVVAHQDRLFQCLLMLMALREEDGFGLVILEVHRIILCPHQTLGCTCIQLYGDLRIINAIDNPGYIINEGQGHHAGDR